MVSLLCLLHLRKTKARSDLSEKFVVEPVFHDLAGLATQLALPIPQMCRALPLLRFDGGLLLLAQLLSLCEQCGIRGKLGARATAAAVLGCRGEPLRIDSELCERARGESAVDRCQEHEQVTHVGGAAQALLDLPGQPT